MPPRQGLHSMPPKQPRHTSRKPVRYALRLNHNQSQADRGERRLIDRSLSPYPGTLRMLFMTVFTVNVTVDQGFTNGCDLSTSRGR